jgi:hypothetical protein
LTISGTSPASATINVYKPGQSDALNGSTITADSNGDWSFDYTGTTLTEGTHAFCSCSACRAAASGLGRDWRHLGRRSRFFLASRPIPFHNRM